MTKVLILNARKKCKSLVEYCIDNNIKFALCENETQYVDTLEQMHLDPDLAEKATLLRAEDYNNPQYYIDNLDFKPDWIFNYRDEYRITQVERELNKYYNAKTQFDDRAFEFFTSKKEQERVCEEIGIPVLENVADKVLVKLDRGYGGGAKYEVVNYDDYKPRINKNELFPNNDYTQRFIDIDYHISIHVIIDETGQASIVNYEYFKYGDGKIYPQNHAYLHITPFLGATSYEKNLLERAVNELFTKHITVKNRIICWQWLREKDGPLWPVDFNARPAGGFETGMYDWATSEFDMLDALIHNDIPDEIVYDNMVTWIYQDTKLTQTERINYKGDNWQADDVPMSPTVMEVFKSKYDL